VGSDTFWVISQHLHGAGEAREKLRNTQGSTADMKQRFKIGIYTTKHERCCKGCAETCPQHCLKNTERSWELPTGSKLIQGRRLNKLRKETQKIIYREDYMLYTKQYETFGTEISHQKTKIMAFKGT
jgi:NAD-dependent dihydropyrimidine dehydrogenase PreA subunit